ncbi:hypothetical protein FQN54_002526 [Arachnomyces sp. PD_36]|nr:hypothetical protein FQN54_002526 [Arachnomyces sp. PD_36]
MASHAPSSGPRGAIQPLNVEQIAHKAQDYDYDQGIPLRQWLRAAGSLLKEASIYEQEGNDEQAYLLLFRHAQLVLVNLSAHPDATDDTLKRSLIKAEQEVKLNLAKLELLKPRINKRYERYIQLARERDSRKATTFHRKDDRLPPPSAADPALASATNSLEADENKELAVRLAQKEFSRRATVRKATRQAGISEDEEQRRRAAGVWGDWEGPVGDGSTEAPDNLQKRIRDVRSKIVEPSSQEASRQRPALPKKPSDQTTSSNYKYPTVPRQSYFASSPPPLPPRAQGYSRPVPSIPTPPGPPELPPKEFELPSRPLSSNEPPPRPSKVSVNQVPSPPPKISETAVEGTATSGNLQPSTYTFKPSAYLENGEPLRTIFLPPDLRTRFLEIAHPNTSRNLETLGILCGTLISNAIFISKLLIPEQESTSDTCESINETTYFDYCDSEDLLVLGWIHTHPTQTCFMSSRDLHTHCSYQLMLPESIAIVCAPSKSPDWGVFRLTDPPGLKHVRGCTKTGLFHPHDETNIYTEALRPGHVVEATGLEFETVDLRP